MMYCEESFNTASAMSCFCIMVLLRAETRWASVTNTDVQNLCSIEEAEPQGAGRQRLGKKCLSCLEGLSGVVWERTGVSVTGLLAKEVAGPALLR